MTKSGQKEKRTNRDRHELPQQLAGGKGQEEGKRHSTIRSPRSKLNFAKKKEEVRHV